MLKLKMAMKRKVIFVYALSLAVGVLLFAYVFEPSDSRSFKLRKTAKDKANVGDQKKIKAHSLQKSATKFMTKSSTRKSDASQTDGLGDVPGSKLSLQEQLQENIETELDDNADSLEIPQSLKSQGSSKAQVLNHSSFNIRLTYEVAGPKSHNRTVTLTFARYRLLEQITFAPPRKDRFTEKEDALFTRPQYTSPWLSQFQSPEALPTSNNVCEDSTPFLLVIILSMPSNRLSRMAVRQTWGSVARTHKWPHEKVNAEVKLLFVMGFDNISPPLTFMVVKEQQIYNDILMLNMTEDYTKLTSKMLAVLHWVEKNCSEVQFVLKADEDSFINIPLLLDYLVLHKEKLSKSVFGAMYGSPPVIRSGKWKLSELEYPFAHFPSYASGSTYIISGDAITDIRNASKYFVPISIEDAFITGILPKAAGIARYNSSAMAMLGDVHWGRGLPKMCEFYTTRFALTDCTAEIFDRMWLAAEINYCGTDKRVGLDIIGNSQTFKRVLF